MSSNAVEYADSIAQQIREWADAEAPFGWRDKDSEEWSGDMPECWQECEHEDDDDHECEADQFETASGLDYLSDALDIHYVVNGDRTYRAARVCIALGGPTAWVNTYTEELEVSWWSATERRPLPKLFTDGLDDALDELWSMGA